MVFNSPNKENKLNLSEQREEKKLKEQVASEKEASEITEVMGAVSEGTDAFVEGNEGNVAEKVTNQKDKTHGGSMTQSGGTSASTVQVKAIPKIEIMIVEISNAIKDELKSLETEAEQAKTPHELSVTVAKIRNLNFTLANLGTITFEAIKALWLKLVRKS